MEEKAMSEEKRKNTTVSNDKLGPMILIAVGILFLLVNVLDINFGRLWPLILVAIGVYIIFIRDRQGASTAKTGHFSAPVDGAASADVELNLSVGEAWVEPLPGDNDLIDAELTYLGDIHFDVSGTEHKTVRLRQTADTTWQWINPANWFGGVGRYEWRISLNRAVPLRLNIHGGMGQSDLNLRDLNVTDLRLHGGAGKMTVTLPASPAGYDARIEGGVGEMSLDIPASTSLNLELRGGVGQVNIRTDPGAAIRLNARGGIGDVNVPPRLKQISGSDKEFELGKSGVWESEGFEAAEHRVVINYEGGVGELRVR
jgi:hypothetical protein